MGFWFEQKALLVLVATSCLLANRAVANWGWGFGSNTTGWGWTQGCGRACGRVQGLSNDTGGSTKIAVGGSAGWQSGFNYSDWAFRNAPFYVNDVLVFRYDPPAPFIHRIYLLPNLWSYLSCDLRRAKMIANVSQGKGDGFEFKLRKSQPYYFACCVRSGIPCNNGTMKFFVMPMLRR